MIDIGAVRKLVGPLQRQVMLMIGKGILSLINDAAGIQTVQVKVDEGLPMNDVQRFGEYGLTSVPLAGAEVVTACVRGLRGHTLIIAVEDRRYRLQGLQGGDVALYNDLGQKVHLGRTGIVIDGAALPITLTNTPKVRLESPRFEVTGDVIDNCDGAGLTMAMMRNRYDQHKHPPGTSTPDVMM